MRGLLFAPLVSLQKKDYWNTIFNLLSVGACMGEIEIKIDNKENKIFCLVRNKWIKLTPEEIVRQNFIKSLLEEYNYNLDQIRVEVKVKMGSTYAKKRADIVVYNDNKKQYEHIIIENKKPNRKDGLDQLHSYMNATGVKFGVWTNGTPVFQLREDPNMFRNIPNIPGNGESLADVDKPLLRRDLEPIDDLVGIIKDCEDEIKVGQGVDAFHEMFKVIFAKIYDEKMNLGKADSKCQFRIGITERPEVAAKRIKDLFIKSRDKWEGVFEEGDKIRLNDYNLIYTASALQKSYLLESDADVLGAAFEIMVNPDFKSDKGQYFTPRQVVRMCVEMLNPKEEDRICDPACGSGGFLIYCMDHVYKKINEFWDKEDEAADHRKDFAQQNTWGIDYDDRLEKVAKSYMLIWGDGRSNIKCFDSLDYNSWTDQNEKLFREFDIVLTNPPFAGHQQKPEILNQFDLSFKGDPSSNEICARQSKAVLFIERCLKLLKPGGRMCIVLPQGILNNLNDDYIRNYIEKKARLLAIVGLHENTFKPFTTPKTSVVFLQKWKKDEYKDDYNIFFAVSKLPGKDKRGNTIYVGEKTRKGFRIKSKNNTNNELKEIQTDLLKIAEEFIKFGKKEGFEFLS